MTGKDLKNSILQLAIQGKLVPQNPNEEPASELLARIRQEKERLVKEKKLKRKDLEITPITDEEKPFEIPESWEWVKIEDIFTINPKVKCDNDNAEAAFIPMEKIEACYGSSFAYEVAKWGDINKNYTCFADGDVAFAKITPCFQNRKSLIFEKLPNGIGAGTTELKVLRQYGETIDRKYLLYFLESSYFIDEATFKGTANQQRIVVGYLENKPFPLPPLAEQQRIVAKIEELMPLVEEYDKNAQKLEALNKALPEQLRQSVLQQAIMGRLVPQDDNDEPASELLARIRQEKEHLVKEKKLKKKDLEITPITDEEKPFEIPESWEWCRLGEICKFLSRGKSPKYADTPNQYPVFAQKCNLKDGGISLEQARFLDPKTIDKWQEELKLKTDDILVNSTGTGTVCRTRLFHEKYLKEYPFTLPDSHVSVIRTFEDIDSAFYFFIFNSKHIQDYWEDHLAGSTNQKELYIGTLHNTIIPLPPLAEQQRIVAKIEELFSVIDNLKTC